ncbi:MAG: hypothetical protein R2827_05060 [Bdellovibrionales bacterium]
MTIDNGNVEGSIKYALKIYLMKWEPIQQEPWDKCACEQQRTRRFPFLLQREKYLAAIIPVIKVIMSCGISSGGGAN